MEKLKEHRETGNGAVSLGYVGRFLAGQKEKSQTQA